MTVNGQPELRTLVGSLQGLRCWYVSGGGAAGPTFQLALGAKVPRQAPLRNPAHPEEFRRFEGEANLLVWCSWRLDGPDRPLTSSDDTPDAVRQGLAELIGACIEAAAVSPPAWDLTVQFSGDRQLRVFCDHVPGEPSFDGNWELWLRRTAAFVGPGARCTIEARPDEGEPAGGSPEGAAPRDARLP
jgi:hypothetical protein